MKFPPKPSRTVYAIELHSSQPDRLAQFYEEVLGRKFATTTYPIRRYFTEIGRFGLIISEAAGDERTQSEPGAITLSLIGAGPAKGDTQRFFLHHARPIGGEIPERYAARMQDPDGNYIAFAASLDGALGRVPPFYEFSRLADCIRDVVGVRVDMVVRRVRESVTRGIDACEYASNRVSFMRRDIRGYSHIVTSREGLFVVTPTSYKRVMRGAYFGLTVKDGVVYCFQSCGPKRGGKNGRILRIPIESGRLGRVRVIATGLDDGCHQIDFVGDDLLIVDCYNGRILRMDPATGRYEAFHPLGELTRQVARDEYHMNSVSLSPDGTIWALLHNTNRKHSEVIVLDQQFAIVRRFTVDAACAHNIVFTNDELEYLIADSTGGKVLSAQRTVIDEGSMRFRGIALDHTTCAIGESLFSTRPFRRFVPGAIHFYDRATWTRQASLRLPAAPTDVRRIDGQDFSLSNYLASQITGAARVGGRPTAVADRREVAAVALGATRSA